MSFGKISFFKILIFFIDSHKAANRQRIFIEMDDGVMARVYWLTKEGDQEVRKELTAREELVMSNQGELEDGSPVKPALVEW